MLVHHSGAKRAARMLMRVSFHVIASEAKQSNLADCGTMDCFVAEPVIGPRCARTRWLLAMTARKRNGLPLAGNPYPAGHTQSRMCGMSSPCSHT